MEIRDITISFSKNKAKLLLKREQEIQNRLEILDSFISCAAHADCIDENEKEYANLKCELDFIYERKGQGSILRSKTRWIEQGKKLTKYFFNLERRNFNLKTIKKLERSQGEFLTKEDDILKEIESFYTKLYASVLLDDNDLFDSFVQNLDIPKLEDTQRDELEGEITLKECRDIFRTFSSGKSPGDDGFTGEFYNYFFDLLGQDLVNCFNYAYKKGEMSVSQRRGVIILVPKEDSNLLSLSNWRPIALLNLDYKIASKVIAKRMEKVLSVLINPDQTGFVKGRYMGQNTRLIIDILEQTKLQSIPGILLQLDFCKAFDTIEWSFIHKVIALLNFGGSIQRWISTFYSNSESAVLNNGFCTNYFKLSRGAATRMPTVPFFIYCSS